MQGRPPLTPVLCMLLMARGSAVGQATPPREAARYVLRATVATTGVEGSVDVTFTNQSPRTLDDAVIVLFPNRFARADDAVNDFNRPFVYPQMDFDPGAMQILEGRDGDTPAALAPLHLDGTPDGCLVRMHIAPLAPHGSRTLRLRFQTRVPYRFGSFGHFEDQLTLLGGWYPYLAGLDAAGVWQIDGPPPLANFHVDLSLTPPRDVALNGIVQVQASTVSVALESVHYVSLVAAAALQRRDVDVGDTHLVLLERPRQRTQRISVEADTTDLMREDLADMLVHRPPGMPTPPAELVVVQAPLRMDLVAPGEGMVVVSDRALRVLWPLRPFHELQIAQGVYAELLRRRLNVREADEDYWWVSEGVSRTLATRYINQRRPETRSVQDWIELFNIFALVDRFETVPKIPFVDAFFEPARVADPLHATVTTFNNARPPGRVILGKLREELGADPFATVFAACLAADADWRTCSGMQSGRDLQWLFAQWLQPYPALNYHFEGSDLNEPTATGFRSRVTVRREASRSIVEPVTVRLHSLGGRHVDVRWDGRGDVAEVSADTDRRVYQTVIDPDRKLIEDRRDDNARPPTPQVVLDSAEVEVSSTEFGISGLVVGRERYDYRKDLAAAVFYTNRGVGFTSGARWHFGTPIDATSFRHNVYGFYSFQSLNGDFTDERHPSIKTPGQLSSLGVRYDYTNVFSYDNPTDERHLRLYGDWYDRSLGGTYNYTDWGADAVLTHPLGSYRTIGAAEWLSGFSMPLGSRDVPNQGLYSLGGSRSIRGIGAEDELARNIALLRAELRQEIYPEIDRNLLDLLVLRRAQVRLFADSGRVSNSAGRAYDVGGWALGMGVGFGAVYDFMGFFPSLAYIEMATRVDGGRHTGEVQFLFGTRQAF